MVNNNAAAVLLVLDTCCKGGEVIASRGELVEIGGSFRIPEVDGKAARACAKWGHQPHPPADYAAAIGGETRASCACTPPTTALWASTLPYPWRELAALAHERGLPLIEDLGSGSFLRIFFSPCGLPNEPTVPAGGAGVIWPPFSGDKVLGGPQAGVIVGRADMVAAPSATPHPCPIARQVCLAALEATLRLYLEPETALRQIPTLRMITCPPQALSRAAGVLAAKLRRGLRDATGPLCSVSLRRDVSRVGWGLPSTTCPLPWSV